jgi:hypothetical protein
MDYKFEATTLPVADVDRAKGDHTPRLGAGFVPGRG